MQDSPFPEQMYCWQIRELGILLKGHGKYVEGKRNTRSFYPNGVPSTDENEALIKLGK